MGLETPEEITFPDIATELSEMVENDQAMRSENISHHTWDESVDIHNTQRMKEIVGLIGWPTISKVGRPGSSNAWLLVQHADRDIAFQAHCLNLMKEVPYYDIDPTEIAYLQDRVCVNQGIEQVYGTQFSQIDDQHIPQPIIEPDDVNARRAAMGMGPLQEQIAMMYEKYPLSE